METYTEEQVRAYIHTATSFVDAYADFVNNPTDGKSKSELVSLIQEVEDTIPLNLRSDEEIGFNPEELVSLRERLK